MYIRNRQSRVKVILLAITAVVSCAIFSVAQLQSPSHRLTETIRPSTSPIISGNFSPNRQNLDQLTAIRMDKSFLGMLGLNRSFERDLLSLRPGARPAPQHMDMPHTLAATYYSLKDNLSATLMLSNQGPHAMEVKVILFSLAGERLDAPSVTLEGHKVYDFEISEWARTGGPSFQEGSLQVSYVGMDMELGGVLKLVDAKESLIFDEELTEPSMMFVSSRLEGVWWLPSSNAELRVAVSNTTDAPLTATVAISGRKAKVDNAPDDNIHQRESEDLPLAAHETRVLELRELLNERGVESATIGGISVKHTGRRGAVLARGFIQEPATGFSNVIEFYDPQTFKSSKLDGAGLRIGRVAGQRLKQVAVARNVGDMPVVLTGRIPYTLKDGTQGVIDLPELRLEAGETRSIQLARAINQSGITMAASAGLEFEHSGAPGSMVISAASFSGDGNNIFRVPLVDAASQQSSTGRYPWAINDGSSTFVYIKNATDQRQEYTLFVSFQGGSYSLGLKTLAPRETMTLDLRKLRDNKVPDANGKTLPAEATHGQISWSVHGPHNHELIGRAEQVDVQNGMSMTSACGLCCPDSFALLYLKPASTVAAVNQVKQFAPWERDVDCYGFPVDYQVPYSSVVTWDSSNTSVATCCDSNGNATAVGPGTTDIIAAWEAEYYTEEPINEDGFQCVGHRDLYFTDVSSLKVLGVQITGADITQDRISVTLIPPGTSGTLDLEILGSTNFFIESAPRSGGSYNESFNIPDTIQYACRE
jgi:hypothetical protein